jgi:hypothetical protein
MIVSVFRCNPHPYRVANKGNKSLCIIFLVTNNVRIASEDLVSAGIGLYQVFTSDGFCGSNCRQLHHVVVVTLW